MVRDLTLGAILSLALAGCVTTTQKVEPAGFDHYTVKGETPRFQALEPWRIPPGHTEPQVSLEVWLKDVDKQEYLKIAPVPELGCPECVAVGGAISADSKRVFFQLYGSASDLEAQGIYYYDTQSGEYRQVIASSALEESARVLLPGFMHIEASEMAASPNGNSLALVAATTIDMPKPANPDPEVSYFQIGHAVLLLNVGEQTLTTARAATDQLELAIPPEQVESWPNPKFDSQGQLYLDPEPDPTNLPKAGQHLFRLPYPGTSELTQGFSHGSAYGKALDFAPRPFGSTKSALAAYSGQVKQNVSIATGCGNYLQVQHGTYLVYYCHLATASPLRVGTSLSTGQTIGTMGKSGNATGVHLHFDVVTPYTYGMNGKGPSACPIEANQWQVGSQYSYPC